VFTNASLRLIVAKGGKSEPNNLTILIPVNAVISPVETVKLPLV